MSSLTDLRLQIDDLQHQAKAHEAIAEAVRAILRGRYGYLEFRGLLTQEEKDTLGQIANRCDLKVGSLWKQMRELREKLLAGDTK